MANGFQEISKDTEAANRGVVPDVLVDIYGNKPPRAAQFDVGATNQAQAQEAQNARRDSVLGDYDHRRP